MFQAVNVKKRYDIHSYEVLNGISFQIQSGEIIGVLGENGAGKTTLIKTMMKLLEIDEGKIEYANKDIRNIPNKKYYSMVASVLEGNRNLYWYLSGYENILYFCSLKKLKIKSVQNEIEFYLKEFELYDAKDKCVGEYSRGMQEKNKQDQKLAKELADLKDKNKDLEDKYLRSEAEIQNMQNRYTKERAQLIKYESQSLAKDILPAMDNLERALSVEADDDVSKQLKKGVKMTLDALVKAMKDHGVVEIEADGVKFDPTLHQAVQTVAAENDDQKDHVVQVLQKGYQYKDRTLRPAMVVVAQ